MRLSKPRIAPVPDAALTPQQAELFKPFLPGPVPNATRTLAQAPRAAKRFLVWSGYTFGGLTDLSARQLEILILRTGWLCRAGYVFSQHVNYGRKAGLTDDEIQRTKKGADA